MEPVDLVLISDPGQDPDDEMGYVMSRCLEDLGLARIKGVVCNLHPSYQRAVLARQTFDMLGMSHVQVGHGTEGGDTKGAHAAPVETQYPGIGAYPPIVPGSLLLTQILEASGDGSVTMSEKGFLRKCIGVSFWCSSLL